MNCVLVDAQSMEMANKGYDRKPNAAASTVINLSLLETGTISPRGLPCHLLGKTTACSQWGKNSVCVIQELLCSHVIQTSHKAAG